MNDKTTGTGQRTPLSKFLAITGLVGLIILTAWIAIQLINVFPNTVNSLASLADSVYNYDPKNDEPSLTLTTDREIMNSGELIAVSWDKQRESDTFTFSYECKDGVAIDIKTEEKEFASTNCDNTYDLGSTDNVELHINSEKNRISELVYNIDVFRKNSNTPAIESIQTVTVVNPNIDPVDNDTEITEYETETVVVTEEGPSQPANTTTTYSTETEYIYEIPTSNPDGTTDLVLSNLNIGSVGFGNFIKTENIIKDIESGVQFTVHNIGTRTSEDWIYEANLPDNTDYKSAKQEPLKPNERATVTINFPQVINLDELHTISITIETNRDTNYANNELSKSGIVIQ
jgi:hypothetical protein